MKVTIVTVSWSKSVEIEVDETRLNAEDGFVTDCDDFIELVE